MLRTLMLVAFGLISAAAAAHAADQKVKKGGFYCVVRDLGCSATTCCAMARCSGHGVTSGWVKQCYDVELPLPLAPLQ
jgi:hypothetical protein